MSILKPKEDVPYPVTIDRDPFVQNTNVEDTIQQMRRRKETYDLNKENFRKMKLQEEKMRKTAQLMDKGEDIPVTYNNKGQKVEVNYLNTDKIKDNAYNLPKFRKNPDIPDFIEKSQKYHNV